MTNETAKLSDILVVSRPVITLPVTCYPRPYDGEGRPLHKTPELSTVSLCLFLSHIENSPSHDSQNPPDDFFSP